MYKIAVLGDRDSVLGFKALGLEVFIAGDAGEGRTLLAEMAHSDYAIIYITESLAEQMPDALARYKDEVMPAMILIPGKSGSLGIGMKNLQSSVERAVGIDIFNN